MLFINLNLTTNKLTNNYSLYYLNIFIHLIQSSFCYQLNTFTYICFNYIAKTTTYFSFYRDLNLKNPIYQKTSTYGHFGRDIFPWENPKTLIE